MPASLTTMIGAVNTFSALSAKTAPSVGPRSQQLPLAGVQFDDQLFVDHRLHFVACRDPGYFSAQRVAVGNEPIGYGRDLGELEIAESKLAGFRFVFDHDFVAGFAGIRSDVHVPAVHLDVAVG